MGSFARRDADENTNGTEHDAATADHIITFGEEI
jgi:hypothetical protein